MKLYKWRGKKNSSFVDYAIALAYECEYEAQFKRNSHGQGEAVLEMEDGSVYIGTNDKGTYNIALLDKLFMQSHIKNGLLRLFMKS